MNSYEYIPPYTITNKTVSLVSNITELLTQITIQNKETSNLHLRKNNRIRTIHASLAIENNSLSLEQMTAIINGKRILANPSEVCEVKNAFDAYNILLQLNPNSIEDLLKAHKVLMNGLTHEAGIFRSGGVGIFAENQLIHMAPPAENIHFLIKDLILWVKNADVHPLIKSCVFHYEFEFIHPFADGNGRMGRMWQTLILYSWKDIFGWLPIETLIKERQREYYAALRQADTTGDSGVFIEFLLTTIYDSLLELRSTDQVSDQVKCLLQVMNTNAYTTVQLMELVQIKHKPTFRQNYLLPALKLGLIKMTVPDKPNSSKQKYIKI